jgi:hypothetical protein
MEVTFVGITGLIVVGIEVGVDVGTKVVHWVTKMEFLKEQNLKSYFQ